MESSEAIGTVFTVNGVVCSPATHVFKDGKPVLKADGTPKQKPGRKAGVSPFKKGAPTATATATQDSEESDATTEDASVLPTVTVPVAHCTPDAVSASSGEAMAAPAMAIAAFSHKETPPEKRMNRQDVTATVETAFGKIGAPESKTETIQVRTFVTEPAKVELGYGLTINIGNYESARVDVKVSVPCYREESDAAYEWARTWAEERVRREVNDIKSVATAQKNPF